VLEVATFYTMFHLEPVGRIAHIQVCSTTPCWLRGADDIKAVCGSRIHAEPHHVSADGAFSWEEVECLGACVNAPLVQIGADTYEDLTAETFGKLIDDLAAGLKPKAGPQVEREFSAPVGGPTSLTDEASFMRSEPTTGGPALTDRSAKEPTEAANVRAAPEPKPPLKPNPDDKKPDPVGEV
jgi:NADH-quinone oxidoreductase subunit E